MLAVLGWLLWRSAAIETELRATELERAHALAERVLHKAAGSRVLFAALPDDQKAVQRADGSFVLDDVGWLDQEASPLDVDPVVDDRLVRAARAEFGDGDPGAAQRAFDELLAAPLLEAVRLRVLQAAYFQASRANANRRAADLLAEFSRAVARLRPTDLGRPALARAAASMYRMVDVVAADSNACFLPPDLFAGLVDTVHAAGQRAAHETIVQRRGTIASIRSATRSQLLAPPHGATTGDATHLLCWHARDDGGRDLAWVTPAQWINALDHATHADALPALGGAFRFVAAADTATTFVVPGVRGIERPDPGSVWLRPGLLGALLLGLAAAFAFAVRWQLRAARAEVAAARTQSDFLTTVTHELKTPLAAIRLLGEMLVEGRAKGREGDYYRMLASEADRLSVLIENVLDLGRIERGDRAYDVRALDVGEVVRETLAMFTPLLERDGGKVQCADLGAAPAVQADRAALVQALVAVLDNARKYGGSPPDLEVAMRRCGDQLAIDIRDHGPGVPTAERDRIFERFVRGAAHAHGSTPGVGIGLHLARRLLRATGGDLVCTDPLDGGPGGCFTFRLPLANPA
ncbi:MAG: HAMP domain-containing histidine kinase [Planctomycetes bacterium]|nr:HAMP domain-containing histidine kinase [Planctomycetota bacterium]